MMRRRLAGLLGAAVVAAVTTTAYVHGQTQDGPGAPPPHERRGPGGPGGFGFGGPGGPGGRFGGPLALLRQLDLSEEQRAQVRQVMEGHRDELRAVGERLRAAHQAQEVAVTAAQFDEGAVRARSAELAAVEADAAVLHARVHSEVFAVLTPEQQAKAAELKAQRQARVEQMRERIRERIKTRGQRTAPSGQ
jgi:Spy/CpxP family protein refolding chaperone